ncbi:hypothetical protein PTSG_00300 [Salpingoeca rosetta]|uniref:intramembrane prenyl-peptidase Rce1 n=1 Tax=Salpingoeca rosetta (strain ATCC 50818 / BSB-021) TaxID=946362 RepID=F2TW33_SALR5|nr:uncharacterized protein PTSG_00300 [Salpingoeca rosetta]EGD72279.1 hypothetical protein PTSG_00300 [Salpingoeca rosetta]|eukprot:XP_004998849.1 hypothetical protein PTSG_00300 [Salpingoeca rosetta]
MLLPVDVTAGGVVSALGLSCGLAALYLVSLYALPQPSNRNHPRAVIARCIGASAATIASPLALPAATGVLDAIWLTNAPATPAASSLMAGSPWLAHHTQATLRGLVLFALLFAGPLLQAALDSLEYRRQEARRAAVRQALRNSHAHHRHPGTTDGTYDDDSDAQHYDEESSSLHFLRNVVVAPITEEIVFRGCITALMLPHMSVAACNLLCPLIFGIAHFHHVLRGVPVSVVSVQLVYTSVFGSLSSLLMLRTHSLAAAVAAHMFCNHMGLPDFEGALNHRHRTLVLGAYVFGLVGFVAALCFHSIV